MLLETVQGSISGPILYALFMSILLDLEFMFAFADDNYVSKKNFVLQNLVKDMEKSL
jgi:hypothetical protein